jgi:hypothetical protein
MPLPLADCAADVEDAVVPQFFCFEDETISHKICPFS